MPVVNLYWSKNALAGIGPSGQNNFTNAREAAESTSNQTFLNATGTSAVSNFQRSSGRGSASFGFKRSYWGFDFTGYTTGTITNLAFHFKPSTNSTSTLSQRLVQNSTFGTEVGNNYGEDDWWDSISDPFVNYSNAFNSNDSNTASSVTLLSQATTDAKADGVLKLTLMNITDYNNLNLAVDTNQTTVWTIGNNSTGNVFVRFDYEPPGYGNNVIGVPSDPDNKINDVGYANVFQVIGVS